VTLCGVGSAAGMQVVVWYNQRCLGDLATVRPASQQCEAAPSLGSVEQERVRRLGAKAAHAVRRTGLWCVYLPLLRVFRRAAHSEHNPLDALSDLHDTL
jgi:hypothetical protein